MTAKRDFVIAEVSFGLDSTLRTYAIDDEAVQLWRILKSLQAAP